MRALTRSAVLFGSLTFLAACASTPAVKTQAYAPLQDHRMFEYEFPVVWKGIEAALKDNKVADRDPADVDALELQKISERYLETDWIYTQSRDKYQEYQVNGSPRRRYLQIRVKHRVTAKRAIGGTEVSVKTTEEIEKLKTDGSSDGYTGASGTDSSRPNELLEKINLAILSAAP